MRELQEIEQSALCALRLRGKDDIRQFFDEVGGNGRVAEIMGEKFSFWIIAIARRIVDDRQRSSHHQVRSSTFLFCDGAKCHLFPRRHDRHL